MKKVIIILCCILLAAAIFYYFVLYEGEPVYQGTLVKQISGHMFIHI